MTPQNQLHDALLGPNPLAENPWSRGQRYVYRTHVSAIRQNHTESPRDTDLIQWKLIHDKCIGSTLVASLRLTVEK